MHKLIAALILVCCAVAATGCMGIMGDSASAETAQRDGSASGAQWQGLAYGKAAAASPVQAPGSTGSGANAGSIGSEIKIIKTADIALEVSDVVTSVDGLKALAAERGGYISSSSLQKGSSGRLSASVVMRIPQAEFENVLARVKAAGTVKSVSTQGEDVTEQYVDLMAQKTSYQNQLAQYNEIMRKAVTVEDVIKVQEQIDRVRTELDRLEGTIRYLDSRIDLATIAVSLQEPEPVGGSTGHDFVSAVNDGIGGFLGMIDALIILSLTLLPLVIIGSAGYGIYRWRKNKTVAAPAPPLEIGDKK